MIISTFNYYILFIEICHSVPQNHYLRGGSSELLGKEYPTLLQICLCSIAFTTLSALIEYLTALLESSDNLCYRIARSYNFMNCAIWKTLELIYALKFDVSSKRKISKISSCNDIPLYALWVLEHHVTFVVSLYKCILMIIIAPLCSSDIASTPDLIHLNGFPCLCCSPVLTPIFLEMCIRLMSCVKLGGGDCIKSLIPSPLYLAIRQLNMILLVSPFASGL